jgi:hypothetical protein
LLLWKQYNILIGHIIGTIDSNKLDNYLLMDDKKLTLLALVIDYILHLKGHLDQFEITLQQVSNIAEQNEVRKLNAESG